MQLQLLGALAAGTLAFTGQSLPAPSSSLPAPPDDFQKVLTIEGGEETTLTSGPSVSYTNAKDSVSYNLSSHKLTVSATSSAPGGKSWELEANKRDGVPFKVGRYPNAGYAIHPNVPPSGPEFRIKSSDGSCSRIEGEIEILTWEQAADGYVEEFQFRFAVSCNYDKGLTKGSFSVRNPPRSARPKVGGNISPTGLANTLDGQARIGGTLECNRDTDLVLRGEVGRVVDGFTQYSRFSQSAHCIAGEGTPWHVWVRPDLNFDTAPFTPGPVRVYVTFDATEYAGTDPVKVSRRVDLEADAGRS